MSSTFALSTVVVVAGFMTIGCSSLDAKGINTGSTLIQKIASDPFPTPSCNGTRPAPKDRRFNSTAVEHLIASFKPRFTNPVLGQMFENTLPNCLDTTVAHENASAVPDTFVITGDINAMWLRDSTNQLIPYIPLASTDSKLKTMLCGAINRQASQVTTNRYANAFNIEPSAMGHHDDQVTTKPEVGWTDSGLVFENKYELNSLVNVLKLSTAYYNATRDKSCFESSPKWIESIETILETITTQQAGTNEDFDSPSYTFMRTTTGATDTLMNNGRGHPAKRCGMSKSYFRASDDAVDLPFNVADNAYAVVQLKEIANLLTTLSHPVLSSRALSLSAEIDAGIKAFGIVKTSTAQEYYHYEVDGFGSGVFMDDANIPSLLSLPYLGYVDRNDPTYLATRERVLSNKSNPWYFLGTAGEGVGGPHEGTNMIWPMAITMRALTSTDDTEITKCLDQLTHTTAGTYFIHESFNRNNASVFTRPWFSWANSLFAELIVQLAIERPHLIFKAE